MLHLRWDYAPVSAAGKWARKLNESTKIGTLTTKSPIGSPIGVLGVFRSTKGGLKAAARAVQFEARQRTIGAKLHQLTGREIGIISCRLSSRRQR